MTLQASGAISFQDIENELLGSHPIAMTEYYGRDSLPASGEIELADFYGQSGLCGTPGAMVAPASHDTISAFTLSWGASATAGVTYVVQRATNATFTLGLLTIYTGANLSVSRQETVVDTYYYRVKATKSGYIDSAYSAYDATTTYKPTCGSIATLSVSNPISDLDGADATWTASSTSGVSYHWDDGAGASGNTASLYNHDSSPGDSGGSFTYSVYAYKSGYNNSATKTTGWTQYTAQSCILGTALTYNENKQLVRVDSVKAGDKLFGKDGEINTVLAVDKVPVGGRKLLKLVGTNVLFTGEHMFMMSDGRWGSFNKAAMDRELVGLKAGFIPTVIIDDKPHTLHRNFDNYDENTVVQLSEGDCGVTVRGQRIRLSMVETDVKAEFVYSFLMSGSRTWNVEGIVVSGMAMGDDIKLIPLKGEQ